MRKYLKRGKVRDVVVERARHFWTSERDQLLRDRYAQEGATKIADMLGVRVYIVRSRAQRLGLRMGDAARSQLQHRWVRRAPVAAVNPAPL